MPVVMILVSVLSGMLSLSVSVWAGQHPVICLLSYALAGCCGMMAMALHAASRVRQA